MRIWIILTVVALVSILTYDNYRTLQDAISTKDPNKCRGIFIPQMKDPCYAAIGIAKLDKSLCSKPSELNERYRCLGVVEGNFTYCGMITSRDTRDFCYYYTVMRTGEKQWCTLILSQEKKLECEDLELDNIREVS